MVQQYQRGTLGTARQVSIAHVIPQHKPPPALVRPRGRYRAAFGIRERVRPGAGGAERPRSGRAAAGRYHSTTSAPAVAQRQRIAAAAPPASPGARRSMQRRPSSSRRHAAKPDRYQQQTANGQRYRRTGPPRCNRACRAPTPARRLVGIGTPATGQPASMRPVCAVQRRPGAGLYQSVATARIWTQPPSYQHGAGGGAGGKMRARGSKQRRRGAWHALCERPERPARLCRPGLEGRDWGRGCVAPARGFGRLFRGCC